jgi:hypothetical protein
MSPRRVTEGRRSQKFVGGVDALLRASGVNGRTIQSGERRVSAAEGCNDPRK